MKSKICRMNTTCTIVVIVIFLPAIVTAQLIPIKTIPLATGDQFLIYPSKNLGMAGVSIALDDPFLDPFVNPAKGIRTPKSILLSSPTFYAISDHNGSAKTFPINALFALDNWFGGFSVSIQQLKFTDDSGIVPMWNSSTSLKDRFANNTYAFGALGKKITGTSTSLAGSIFWASLNGVDGVDLLYPRSQGIEQFGNIVDYRLGIFSELSDEKTFEALILYNRFKMTHDVSYSTWNWMEDWAVDYVATPSRTRVKRNLDQSRTWGIHIGYTQPLVVNSWRIGGMITSNWKTHPKIPNYELMNIPRDPGDSWAYNFGLGVGKSTDHSSFGIDVIYEPIWSNTWANAITDITTQSGKVIHTGAKTVENDFRFSNSMFRIGVSHEKDKRGFQIGLQVHSISYVLNQTNHVEERYRTQRENWMEWILSWGLSFDLKEFKMHYQGRLILGTGRPGLASGDIMPMADANASYASNADFLVAPSGALALDDAVVFTQRITIEIPIDN